MNENFLLQTSLAQTLFHECAKELPVIDYHNHLNVGELLGRKKYENLARLWLTSDPYKHRAMRILGIPERYITGETDDREKYSVWMQALPKLVGNPLYDWAILEMRRVFGIEFIPGETRPEYLWDQIQERLDSPEYTAYGILEKFHTEYAAPCAGAEDDISGMETLGRIAPSLRGDTIVHVNREIVQRLETMTGKEAETLEDYFGILSQRLDAFERAGCRFADHALDNEFEYLEEDGKSDGRFRAVMKGESLQKEEADRLACAVLRFLAGKYAEKGWTMQLHIGAERNTSTRLRKLAGPAGGFAGIGSCCRIQSLTQMLDEFEQMPQGLPRILLFTLNPSDHAAMAVLEGSYSQDNVEGKVQLGPAWWWCDHLHGMRDVFDVVSSYGVLWGFLGMTTDSRSVLSFVRHEYFRRALCGWIGEKAAKGEWNASVGQIRELVERVCYKNAARAVKGEETSYEF